MIHRKLLFLRSPKGGSRFQETWRYKFKQFLKSHINSYLRTNKTYKHENCKPFGEQHHSQPIHF